MKYQELKSSIYAELSCYGDSSIAVMAIIDKYLASNSKKSKWIKNTGVKPDLHDGTKIEIKHKCGSREIREFKYFRWNLNNGQDDIIKYRVVK
jgi:hypothetical protein